ncbi:MAG: 23S rRNA (adenine(2503)-C(2))-methyltransferase RlmN [Lachnospiraceae bacterium]|nr:23S rRNA (adenine(2503)-C(2))-methyltransferase RlmN [Lachnospiraceae bacterium]
MPGKDIKSMTFEELSAEVAALGEKAFRAGQLYQWMHRKLARGFHEMTNLPKTFRQTLSTQYEYTSHILVDRRISKLDGTEKYLFGLHDGNVVESVLMRYHFGNSVCISSQVGCRMGCRFCASTIGGLNRNLTPAEMLDQVYSIQRITGERVSHLVVMGTGEPLDNYDSLLRFLKLLSDENGLNLSQRNITVSTCGLPERIHSLADEQLQITLALSLHAPSQEKRKLLMPVAYKYDLRDVLDACRYYFDRTGRRITFEYSLVGGINDAPEDAAQLAKLLKGWNCHINLIPVNPIKERDYVQSDQRTILAFRSILEKNGMNVTVRREMGRDIAGACGQLRKGYIDSGNRSGESCPFPGSVLE